MTNLQIDDGDSTKWEQVDSLNQPYYGGLDSSIYFGVGGVDLFISELITIECQMFEAVKPLFRYSDRVFSRALRGSRLVQGQFTINFQQVYLMHLILEKLRAVRETEDTSSSEIATPQKISAVTSAVAQSNSFLKGIPELQTAVEAADTYLQVKNPQTKKRLADSLNAVTSKQKASSSLKSKLTQNQLKAGWKPDSAGATPASAGASLLARVKENLSPFTSRFELEDGFQISIVCGAMNESDYISQYQSDETLDYTPKGFEEIYDLTAEHLVSGDLQNAIASLPPYTVRKIFGVEITGVSFINDDSGRPLLESYSFLAKDMI